MNLSLRDLLDYRQNESEDAQPPIDQGERGSNENVSKREGTESYWKFGKARDQIGAQSYPVLMMM